MLFNSPSHFANWPKWRPNLRQGLLHENLLKPRMELSFCQGLHFCVKLQNQYIFQYIRPNNKSLAPSLLVFNKRFQIIRVP